MADGGRRWADRSMVGQPAIGRGTTTTRARERLRMAATGSIAPPISRSSRPFAVEVLWQDDGRRATFRDERPERVGARFGRQPRGRLDATPPGLGDLARDGVPAGGFQGGDAQLGRRLVIGPVGRPRGRVRVTQDRGRVPVVQDEPGVRVSGELHGDLAAARVAVVLGGDRDDDRRDRVHGRSDRAHGRQGCAGSSCVVIVRVSLARRAGRAGGGPPRLAPACQSGRVLAVAYSSSSLSAKPNSAPPAGRGTAQIRPPIAATRRAHTNSPMPAPVAEAAVPGDR